MKKVLVVVAIFVVFVGAVKVLSDHVYVQAEQQQGQGVKLLSAFDDGIPISQLDNFIAYPVEKEELKRLVSQAVAGGYIQSIDFLPDPRDGSWDVDLAFIKNDQAIYTWVVRIPVKNKSLPPLLAKINSESYLNLIYKPQLNELDRFWGENVIKTPVKLKPPIIKSKWTHTKLLSTRYDTVMVNGSKRVHLPVVSPIMAPSGRYFAANQKIVKNNNIAGNNYPTVVINSKTGQIIGKLPSSQYSWKMELSSDTIVYLNKDGIFIQDIKNNKTTTQSLDDVIG